MEYAVLATLYYGAASGTPLTVVQVWRHLIAPGRVGTDGVPTLGHITRELGRLTATGQVWERDGWYLPAHLTEVPMGQTESAGTSAVTADRVFERRLVQANINADKWRSMLSHSRWLQVVPFVRALAASGSLAAGTTGRDSDWDLFVIARHGRLYTVRLGLVLVSALQGRLRTKHQRIAPDRFCFNHYVTDQGLKIRHRSLFVADALARLVPFYDPDNLFGRLAQANGWTRTYLMHGVAYGPRMRQTIHPSRPLTIVRRIAEAVLSSSLGTILETVLCRWQQWRIDRDPVTHARGGRVIADDREIEFHPRSAERGTLARYNRAMTRLGISLTEEDSGLH